MEKAEESVVKLSTSTGSKKVTRLDFQLGVINKIVKYNFQRVYRET